MCTFISLTVNADFDPVLVEATFNRSHRHFREIPSPPEMPAATRVLVHSVALCDCCTAIGSGFHEIETPYDPADLAKLRRKGWSEARIERWKTQKPDVEGKDQRTLDGRFADTHQELASWAGLLRELIATPTVVRVGLMHDFYSSGPGYDHLPLIIERPAPVADLTEEHLFGLPGGTLVQWTR